MTAERRTPAAAAEQNASAEKAATPKPPAKGAQETPRLSAAQRAATAADNLARAARRASTRGRAAERAAYNARRTDGIDRLALSGAMARVLAAQDAAAAGPAARTRTRRVGPRAAPGTGELPGNPIRRWVPIGPSVVRSGQAIDRPRVSGRIRALAVEPAAGLRVYAGAAIGGVWYTDDGGLTWSPFGGWSQRSRRQGGIVSAQAVGSLLVSFGATQAQDVVMVGTGDFPVRPPPLSAVRPTVRGVGVLTGSRPVALGANEPWEADSGLTQLETTSVLKLVRSPASVPGKSGAAAVADRDVVVACTTQGAYVGIRQPLAAGGGLPARDGFVWTLMAGLAAAFPNATIHDAVWLTGGRLYLTVFGAGLVYTDDLGVTIQNVPSLQAPAVAVNGAASLAVGAASTLYFLGDGGGVPGLWRIPNAVGPAVPAAATAAGGVPAGLWGTQRDYDQAIAVDAGAGPAGADRVYLGGSTVTAHAGVRVQPGASLYCFDVIGPAPFTLQPAPRISTINPPSFPVAASTGAGANQAGLIGNNVHADVHAIALAGPAASRQVWVGNDGGVFVSRSAGRVNTFASANVGLATLQPEFVRGHPASGHFVAAGLQDNGTVQRSGDSVWTEVYVGDGGGLAFVAGASHVMVRQYIKGKWNGPAASFFRDPLTRGPGGPAAAFALTDVDNVPALLYSGAATTFVPAVGPNPAHPRLALGTHRVWITDDLTGAAPNTWRTLPAPPGGAASDGRAGPPVGTAVGAAQAAVGVPAPAMGPVITMTWAAPTELLVVYQQGVVRYTEGPVGTWTVRAWRITDKSVAIPRTTTLTDIAAVPKTQDFYVASTGVIGGSAETVWFFNHADGQFHATNLRHKLDIPHPPGPATLGPRDPAYSVAVDPGQTTDVYVGTATGVWLGSRTNLTGGHTWTAMVDGLPEAEVQDLDIWVDPTVAVPGAVTARLLRAGVQARGVWEVDLAANAKRVTWIRASAHDNRRIPQRAGADVLKNPPPADRLDASPDIVVRPHWPVVTPPKFLGALASAPLPDPYQLWTFQTAFRWLYPSVVADGQWSEGLANLVALHHSTLNLPATPVIDTAVWDDIVGTPGFGFPVGGVRVTAGGTVTRNIGDPLAVYRPPWHTTTLPSLPAREIDLAEAVQPSRTVGGVWEVFKEPATVDVLVHHRDSRAVPANQAYAVLLWCSGIGAAALMALPCAPLVTYFQGVAGGANPAVPPGWNLATGPGAVGAKSPVLAPVDARMPRTASIDVDLSAAGLFVTNAIFVAYVGSSADDLPLALPTTSTTAAVLPVTISDMVTAWPYTAARVIHFGPPRPT